jgi:hypothetical protein
MVRNGNAPGSVCKETSLKGCVKSAVRQCGVGGLAGEVHEKR